MSFYHNVNPGDDFKPSARLENDVRNLLNALNGFKGGGKHTATASKAIRVPVYNTTDDPFVAGQAVSLDISGNIIGDAYPAIAFDEDYPCFGVCLDGAASGGICDCVLCGLAIVELTGGTGSFARPVDGGTFELADDGLKVLNITGGTTAVVFVGDYEGKRYVEGKGISITGTTNANEYEISANLVQGTNISITDGTGGSKVISCTAGGGSTFYVPNYNQLYVDGNLTSGDHGRATTFLIPVKSGTIYISDDGGGAVASYTDITGTTHHEICIEEGEDYDAPADGWLRVSVYDDGTHAGDCLRFYSSTGGMPLYKYGGGNGGGVGYPDYIALAGGTFSNALGTITDEDYSGGSVPGPSSMPSDPKIGITYFLPVPAGKAIKYYASVAVLVRFAPVSGGYHFYYDLSNELEWTPNCDGWLRVSILDDGNHSSECFRLYVGGEQWSDAVPLYKGGKFGNNGVTGISSSISGGTVTITVTNGTGSVKFKPGNNVTISGSNGVFTISATGGSSGDGFVPDWWYNGMTGNQGSTSNLWIGGATDEITQTEDMNSSATFTPSEDAFIVPSGGGWIYCFARVSNWDNNSFSAEAHIVVNGAMFKVIEGSGNSEMVVGSGFAIPVRAGAKVWWRVSKSGNASIFKGCVFYGNSSS